MDIYCFGDSITFGEFDTQQGGWVDRLKTECMRRFQDGAAPDTIFNLGIGGETSQMMRSRLTAELETRLDHESSSLVLFAYGANDAAEADGSCLVPEKIYGENLSWAIDEARRRRCEARLLTITPLAPAADGSRNLGGRFRSNTLVAAYNRSLEELAVRKSVEIIDIHSAFMAHDLASLFVADGLHPNSKGHAVIYELVKEKVLG